MTKRMLIDATHPEETRVVVLDGNRLEEFDVETSTKRTLKGNIYLAKVVRVEPSLQAAFVDYGGNRHGFLAFSEIHPDYYQIPVADRQRLLEMAAAEAEEDAAREHEEGDAAAEQAGGEMPPQRVEPAPDEAVTAELGTAGEAAPAEPSTAGPVVAAGDGAEEPIPASAELPPAAEDPPAEEPPLPRPPVAQPARIDSETVSADPEAIDPEAAPRHRADSLPTPPPRARRRTARAGPNPRSTPWSPSRSRPRRSAAARRTARRTGRAGSRRDSCATTRSRR